jgi:hypothetical protein
MLEDLRMAARKKYIEKLASEQQNKKTQLPTNRS